MALPPIAEGKEERYEVISWLKHDFDIVYGPIADDRVGRQIIRFKDGDIDFATFLEKLKFMKGITFQYAFCSEKAISKLKPL